MKNKNVSVLFCDPRGIYPTLVEDWWDEKRDARNYAGIRGIVAHPPCGRWCKLAPVNQKRWGAKVGDDGGCFASALRNLRFHGGVLEHPALSLAWPAFGLEKPTHRGWNQINDKEWVCEVWQSAYGHRARKRTWLLYHSYVGRPPFELRWGRAAGTHQIGGFDITKPVLSRREGSATPLAFALELIKLAEHSQ